LPADDPRRGQLRAHAESWASQAMARRLIAFYEKVRAGAPQAAKNERGPLRTPLSMERSS
jgi:hypothetical protein